MIEEIKSEKKLKKLSNILSEFLWNCDCDEVCCKCEHERVCKDICKLHTALDKRYLKNTNQMKGAN